MVNYDLFFILLENLFLKKVLEQKIITLNYNLTSAITLSSDVKRHLLFASAFCYSKYFTEDYMY